MIKKLFGNSPSYQYNIAICCIVKDESAYLQEWVDYHFKIGVDHFFIYDNESKIPVATTLSKYVNEGVVSAVLVEGKTMQLPVYTRCLEENGHKCQWLGFIDADEFIVPKSTNGNLKKFLLPFEKYGGLGINWLLFGSSGHIEKQNGQIYNYTKRTLQNNPVNSHIKSIIQPRFVEITRPLDPHHFIYKKKRFCVNENYTPISGPFSPHSSNKIQLNHYNLRSLEEYKEKVERGRADLLVERSLEDFYNTDKDSNIITDEAIIELLKILG